MRKFLILLLLVLPFSSAHAQEDDFAQRLALGERMLEIRPARDQLEYAVDTYIERKMMSASAEDSARFRNALIQIMNVKALEKITIDAYAETFTVKELEAMVAYYSLPEAQSASHKMGTFSDKVSPEIVKMLDRALLRVRTEAAKQAE